MANPDGQPEYHYLAYIDEAGDPGLDKVKPIDMVGGSSEWLVLAAVVVGVPNEANISPWVKDILKAVKSQRRDLHFTNFKPWKKTIICSEIAKLPIRCFVVCSNKKNMRKYRNPFAEKYKSSNWFYAWMSRLLLERVTHFVATKSVEQHGEIKKLCLEFSERSGLTAGSLNTYYEWLKMKSTGNDMMLKAGDLVYETLHRDLIFVYPHKRRHGLQLADSVASAFFKACDYLDTRECDPTFAKLLEPRMCRIPDGPGGELSGYGVKLMPKFKTAALLPAQAEIFTFCGYPKQWWAPTSATDANNPLAKE